MLPVYRCGQPTDLSDRITLLIGTIGEESCEFQEMKLNI